MTAVPVARSNAVFCLMQATDDTKAKGALHALYNEADAAKVDPKNVFLAFCSVAAGDYSADSIEAARKKIFPDAVPEAPPAVPHKPHAPVKPHVKPDDDDDDDDDEGYKKTAPQKRKR